MNLPREAVFPGPISGDVTVLGTDSDLPRIVLDADRATGPGHAGVSSFSFSCGSRCCSQALSGAEVSPWTTTEAVMAKVA